MIHHLKIVLENDNKKFKIEGKNETFTVIQDFLDHYHRESIDPDFEIQSLKMSILAEVDVLLCTCLQKTVQQ